MISKLRGFTLVEVVTGGFVLIMLLVAVYALLVNGRRMYEHANASYMVSQDFESGVRLMRADLKETALISLRSYPNPTYPEALPGISMIMPRSYDDPTQLLLSPAGAPQYGKYVFYTLESGDGPTANIVRWEQKIDPLVGVPSATLDLPQMLSDPSHKRVVFRNILTQKQQYPGVAVNGGDLASDDHGGFHLSFVYYMPDGSEALRDYNPAEVVGGSSINPSAFDVGVKGISRLVHMDIQGLSSGSATGKPTYYDIHFRISPRH